MTTLFHPRFRPLMTLLLAGLMGLGTGCQTARVPYDFQPLAHGTPAALPKEPERIQPRPEAAPQAVEFDGVVTAAQPSVPVKQLHRHGGQPRPQPVATTQPTGAKAASVLQKLQRRHSPQAPAEQGLGLTVLGLLGMVAVVVGLIGALVGGGPVWLAVAAVGAIVVLLAYLIPKAQI